MSAPTPVSAPSHKTAKTDWSFLPLEMKLLILQYTAPVVVEESRVRPLMLGGGTTFAVVWAPHLRREWTAVRSVNKEWDILMRDALRTASVTLRGNRAIVPSLPMSLADLNRGITRWAKSCCAPPKPLPQFRRRELVNDWYVCLDLPYGGDQITFLLRANIIFRRNMTLADIEWTAHDMSCPSTPIKGSVDESLLAPCIKIIGDYLWRYYTRWHDKILSKPPEDRNRATEWVKIDRIADACALPTRMRKFCHDAIKYQISSRRGGRLLTDYMTFLKRYRRNGRPAGKEREWLIYFEHHFGVRGVDEIVLQVKTRLCFGEGKINNLTPKGPCQLPYIIF